MDLFLNGNPGSSASSQKDFLCYQLQSWGTIFVRKWFVLVAEMVILLLIEYCYNIIMQTLMLYKQVSFLFMNLLLPHANCSSRMCFLADGYLFLPFFWLEWLLKI